MQQDCPPQSPLRADVEVLRNEIERLALLVEQFLDFARPKSPEVTPFPGRGPRTGLEVTGYDPNAPT
jgi:hypothetical protein